MKDIEIIIPDMTRTERDDELDIIDRKMGEYARQKLGIAKRTDYDNTTRDNDDCCGGGRCDTGDNPDDD